MSLPTPESLIRQALIFRHAGESAKAIDLLREALAVQPDHLNAQIQLGATYLDLGKTAPAMDALSGAVRQAPGSAIVRRLLALGYLQKNDPKRAKAEADEAARLGLATASPRPSSAACSTASATGPARRRRCGAASSWTPAATTPWCTSATS